MLSTVNVAWRSIKSIYPAWTPSSQSAHMGHGAKKQYRNQLDFVNSSGGSQRKALDKGFFASLCWESIALQSWFLMDSQPFLVGKSSVGTSDNLTKSRRLWGNSQKFKTQTTVVFLDLFCSPVWFYTVREYVNFHLSSSLLKNGMAWYFSMQSVYTNKLKCSS